MRNTARRIRSYTWAAIAVVMALAIMVAVVVFADADEPPDASPSPGAPNVVSDDGGLFDVVPVPVPTTVPALPADPVPSSVPALPVPLDPDGAANDEPVTIALSPNGSDIRATVTVSGRDVVGSATGMDPGVRYVSLYYGSQSTADPGQTLTCADVRTAAAPRAWGITPEWAVAADGSGTLTGTAPRDLADGVYTMSVREVPAGAADDPYALFNPVQYPVRACGAVPQ